MTAQPWTESYLYFVLPLSAEDVLQRCGRPGGVSPESRKEWAWIEMAQRLTWLYGVDEALRRLNVPQEMRAAA